ncbi:MAG TPA: electron transport complex subunit RsxE [Clostridiales bacterium]|mgnify:CR=1 FL=1|jgi:electron transport complex protein RnfE|nr:electron transport complex subunit RsxE [Clostridiales bacterium]HCG36510.1 electron transport complex subunit RsxE [Clostridiales bacterium]
MNRYKSILCNGLITHNPTFVQLLGMCPTLAVTTSAINGLAMGLSTMVVLMFSNLFISLLRKFIPEQIRIAAYVVVIAGFVSAIDLLLQAFLPELSGTLGLYIPLIVVNCIIFARAESFASKNPPIDSMMDGVGMGFGFTLALTLIGLCREFLGNGSIFGINLFGQSFSMLIFIMPAGAFLTLGFLLAAVRKISFEKKQESKDEGGAR